MVLYEGMSGGILVANGVGRLIFPVDIGAVGDHRFPINQRKHNGKKRERPQPYINQHGDAKKDNKNCIEYFDFSFSVHW